MVKDEQVCKYENRNNCGKRCNLRMTASSEFTFQVTVSGYCGKWKRALLKPKYLLSASFNNVGSTLLGISYCHGNDICGHIFTILPFDGKMVRIFMEINNDVCICCDYLQMTRSVLFVHVCRPDQCRKFMFRSLQDCGLQALFQLQTRISTST